jgi:hypothetical protein
MLPGKSPVFSTLRASSLHSHSTRSRSFLGLFGRNDFNDSIDHARNLGKFKKSSSYDGRGNVGRNDLDYYQFTIKKTGSIKLKLNSDDRNRDPIQFSIVDRRDRTISINGKRLFSEIDGGEKAKISARLGAGTYYIKIESEDGRNEDYTFKLKFERSGDDENNWNTSSNDYSYGYSNDYSYDYSYNYRRY